VSFLVYPIGIYINEPLQFARGDKHSANRGENPPA
jgi:hypothetical protein